MRSSRLKYLVLIVSNAILFGSQDVSLAVTRSFEVPILLVSTGPDGKPTAGTVGKMDFSLRRNLLEENAPLRVAVASRSHPFHYSCL